MQDRRPLVPEVPKMPEDLAAEIKSAMPIDEASTDEVNAEMRKAWLVV